MNTKNITDKVSYCGVNDRTSALFENIWDLPNGVTYNIYIVRGKKATAIIDGSDTDHASEFISHITDTIETSPDYLVINHIEPDHSGAIPMLKEKFPKLKIVGNAKTIEMLKGFYNIESDVIEIRDGDTIDLGDLHLRFILTPMVHWPETMFTYAEEEKILFTGDAFGCFGALNGAVIDKHMNTDIYLSEIYRYYACIIAKYGQSVEKAFSKIKNLPVDYICTTHGPVWHSKKEEIGDLYSRMAKWEGEKGVVVAYGSMYGNTAAMADRIASLLAGAGIKEIRVYDLSHTPQSQALADIMRFKGLILLSPTYNSEIFPPVASLATAILARGVKNRIIGVAGSFSWGSQAVRKLRTLFQDKPVTLLEPSPEMKQAIKSCPNDGITKLVSAMVSELESNL